MLYEVITITYKSIQVFIEQGQPQKALKIIQSLPAWEDQNPERYFLKGTALCQLGKVKDAEVEFDHALSSYNFV